MTFSIHTASVPVFVHMLGNLSVILEKAEAWAKERNVKPEVLLQARLAPDMLPLSAQIQIATDHAKGAAARLSGAAVPSFADDEKSFADLQARLQKTIDFLNTTTAEQFEGAEDREVVLKLRDTEMKMPGSQYLLNMALPNFYFHATTAYDILRHNGVPLGKRDFLAGRR